MTRTAATLATRHRCGACRSQLVYDRANGETVCPKCGIVAPCESVHASEPRGAAAAAAAAAGEAAPGIGAAGESTLARHDRGIATSISPASQDYAGRKIPPESASQMRRLRISQKRIRASAAGDRRLAEVLMAVRDMCDAASLTPIVRETAAMSYRRLAKKVDLKGTSLAGMAAASVYMACKRHGIVRSIEEICSGICASEDEARKKARLAFKCYRHMVMEMSGESGDSPPSVPIAMYISKMVNMARADVRIERVALQLDEITSGSESFDGKTPHGIAAACLYIAAILLGQPMAQRDISETSQVADVTIRTRCREILERRQIRLVLEPARRADAGAESGAAEAEAKQSLLFGFDVS